MKSTSGLLVSLEGISGTGKTYLLAKLRKEIPHTHVTSVREVMDRTTKGIGLRIIEILSSTGDPFFRMGLPLCETFLLLALKMYDYEAAIAIALNEGKIVIEDRSIDTIAIYQSILLCPDQPVLMLDKAEEIYTLAARWRRPPDITFLIEDDFDVAIGRAQNRDNRKYADDELLILRNAAHLYTKHAERHSSRIIRLDRRIMSASRLVRTMNRQILEGAQGG